MKTRGLLTFVAFVACFLPELTWANWQIEVEPVSSDMQKVNTIRDISNVVVDSGENPHFFLEITSGQSYHYFFDGIRWQNDMVPIGAGPVAIDSLGHFHAATSQFEPEGGCLATYTFFDGTSSNWVFLPDAEAMIGGAAGAVAVDAKNDPHFLYSSTGGLKHARYSAGKWVTELVQSGKFGRMSMALTSSGRAHVAFSGTGDPSGTNPLFWASNVSGKWKVAQIGEGEAGKIALDKSGLPHIVSTLHGKVQYSKSEGGQWVSVNVLESLGLQGWSEDPNIVIDADGHPNIFFVFHNDTDDYPVYAHFDGQFWLKDTFDVPYSGKTHMLMRVAHGKTKMHVLYFEFNPQDHFNINTTNSIPLDWVWASAADVKLLALKAITSQASVGDPAQLEVVRTGRVSRPLDVYYTLSGTAVNGTDYQQLSGTVTIPAGSSSELVSISPLAGKQSAVKSSQVKKTVTLRLYAKVGFKLVPPVRATVQITGK